MSITLLLIAIRASGMEGVSTQIAAASCIISLLAAVRAHFVILGEGTTMSLNEDLYKLKLKKDS